LEFRLIMWKPTEKIRYEPRPGEWPNKIQAEGSTWFTPIKIGQIQLKARTWVPAMVPWRSTEEGIVTDQVLAWYERFAKGQPGCIVIEATGIQEVPSGPLLRIGHDRFIPGLKELSDTVHLASGGQTKLFIQLIDFLSIRRRPEPEKYFQRFLNITDAHRAVIGAEGWTEQEIRDHLNTLDSNELGNFLTQRELDDLRMGARERVTDVQFDHIKQLPNVLPELFSDAAERAQKAGIDGIELHYAHAYTMASFLSRKNNREDGYGGSLDNRARLPLEVFAAVRKRVGDEYPVGCRFLSDECIPGGSDVDDATYFWC
jgi:2,4-dienoyl-CoA reductase-like NADH-dependent reductase (Old Yellow Enzyme family)